MIELFSSGSDNFFKYTFTIGIMLIAFSYVYPLREEQKLDVSALELESKVEILKYQLREVSELDSQIVKVVRVGKGRKRIGQYDIVTKDSLNKKLDSLKILYHKKRMPVIDKLIEYEYEEKKINLNKSHARSFFVARWSLSVLGVILVAIGFRYWLSAVYLESRINGKNIDASFQTGFVRHLDFAKFLWSKMWFKLVLFAAAATCVYCLIK